MFLLLLSSPPNVAVSRGRSGSRKPEQFDGRPDFGRSSPNGRSQSLAWKLRPSTDCSCIGRHCTDVLRQKSDRAERTILSKWTALRLSTQSPPSSAGRAACRWSGPSRVFLRAFPPNRNDIESVAMFLSVSCVHVQMPSARCPSPLPRSGWRNGRITAISAAGNILRMNRNGWAGTERGGGEAQEEIVRDEATDRSPPV